MALIGELSSVTLTICTTLLCPSLGVHHTYARPPSENIVTDDSSDLITFSTSLRTVVFVVFCTAKLSNVDSSL